MSREKQPRLGLVDESGHSQDILEILGLNNSENSDLNQESPVPSEMDSEEEAFDQSEVDEILDGYVPLSEYDDSRVLHENYIEVISDDDEPEDLSRRSHTPPVLIQKSLLAYTSHHVDNDKIPMHSKPRKDTHSVMDYRSSYSRGRPKDSIREEFTVTQQGKKAKCNDCNLQISNRVDVMKNHRNVCKIRRIKASSSEHQEASAPSSASVPSTSQNNTMDTNLPISQEGLEIEEVYSFQLASQSSTSSSLAPSSQASAPELPASAPSEHLNNLKRKFGDWDEAPKTKKPLRKFLDTLTAKERHQIDLQVGKMIYGCNLPFATVENHEFKELLRKLRPAYFPPNRKLIGNEILEEVYMEVKERLTEVIAKKEVTLVQDGWGTNQTQSVVAHSVHSGSKAFFLNAVAPGSATKDADYCLGVLSAAIEECQNVHKCQVIGFVTDNCNVMLSLRIKLHESHPDIFVFGCNAHYLNLVGQKVIPHDKIDNIVKIQKYFKNHHFQSAALTAAKGKRPVLPGLTRWNSQIDCIENYIENHAIYLDLARKNPRKFDSSITQMINDFSLYTAAEKLESLAKPIAVALDRVQSNSASLSDAVSEWIKLRNDCPFENDSCYTYFQRKLTEALNETALAAYILDPRYRGDGLSPDEKTKAYTWMDKLNDNLALLSMDLEAKNDDRFPQYLLRDDRLTKIDPKTFWNVVKTHCSSDSEACNIACRLQKLPASGSSIERCFSTLSSIMTKTRNRLGIEKAGKLCTIYQSLHFLPDEEYM